MPRDFLRLTMQRYWMNPGFALWRAVELRLLDTVDFAEPILDLGCGDGQFAELLFRSSRANSRGREIVGLDLSPRSLQEAEARGVYTRTVQADAARLPLDSESFGSVVSNCVLEHVPEDVAAVQEVARVLRPGGRLAFTVPTPQLKDCLYTVRLLRERGDTDQAEDYLREFDRRLAHYHYRSAEEWTALLHDAGLQVERLTPYLPEPAVLVWNRIDDYLVQPAVNVTGSRKLALLILTPRSLRNWLIRLALRKYYEMDVGGDARHGCLMVVARKPRAGSSPAN